MIVTIYAPKKQEIRSVTEISFKDGEFHFKLGQNGHLRKSIEDVSFMEVELEDHELSSW